MAALLLSVRWLMRAFTLARLDQKCTGLSMLFKSVAASAWRRGRGIDQHDEQVVGIPHDADLECVGTRG